MRHQQQSEALADAVGPRNERRVMALFVRRLACARAVAAVLHAGTRAPELTVLGRVVRLRCATPARSGSIRRPGMSVQIPCVPSVRSQRFQGVARRLPIVVHDVSRIALVDAALNQGAQGLIHEGQVLSAETVGVVGGEHFYLPVERYDMQRMGSNVCVLAAMCKHYLLTTRCSRELCAFSCVAQHERHNG